MWLNRSGELNQAFCEMLKATRKHNVSLKAAVQADTSRLRRTHPEKGWDPTSKGKP